MGFLVGLGYVGYIQYTNQDYMQKLDILYFILSTVAIMITLYYIRFWKYIIMPYSLNFHGIFSHNTFIETRNKRTLFLDYFFDKKAIKSKSVIESIFTQDLKCFALVFNNFTAIDIDNYRQNKEKILHYLGLIEENYEVSVHPTKRRSVKLVFYKLPNYYEFDLGAMIKREKIFLGIYEEGFLYRSFDTLDHHLIVGESGSGKSNFMQLLNLNFLLNKHRINKLYMVDLKGGVELKRYETIPFVQFISDIEELDKFLDLIIKDLKETQEYMLLHNIRQLDKYTMLIFDEIGAVSVYPNKKLRESIFNKLALIAMQGRASGILLFLFGQKIDNTILPTNIVNNLQSRVLLKTSNDNNINLIDLKDNIRERVTAMEIQDFPKGRAIYKNGLTSDKYLIQLPFVTDILINALITHYSLLK